MKKAEPIQLSSEERSTLNAWAGGRKFPLRMIQRAQIICMADDGVLSQDIAQTLQISRPTVQLWRQRFLSLRLAGLEKDAPRPGRFPRITQHKINAVVEATLHTTPADATHWSTRTMAKAQGLSEASVRRIWHRHNLKPHLVETFKLSQDKQFIEKLHDVVGLYLNPPDKAIVLCVDEKSQIQALERTRPPTPFASGDSSPSNARLHATWDYDVIRRFKHARWSSYRRLYASPSASRIYSLFTTHQRQDSSISGLAPYRRQLWNTQASTRSEMAETPSTVPFSLCSDIQLLAQYGGTLVRRNYKKTHTSRIF